MSEMSDIRQYLQQIVAELQAMNRALIARAPAPAGKASSSAPTIASDADLDGPHGDPVVKYPPKDWPGEDFRGMPLSQTSASFCERMAGYWDWQASGDEKSGDEKKIKSARFKRLDAARARGWERRLRADEPKGRVPADEPIGGDDIPF